MTPIETLKRLAELQKKHRINANDSEYVAQIKKQFGYFKLNKEFESTDFAALADYVEGLREAVRDLSGYGDDPCAMPDELKIKHGIF